MPAGSTKLVILFCFLPCSSWQWERPHHGAAYAKPRDAVPWSDRPDPSMQPPRCACQLLRRSRAHRPYPQSEPDAIRTRCRVDTGGFRAGRGAQRLKRGNPGLRTDQRTGKTNEVIKGPRMQLIQIGRRNDDAPRWLSRHPSASPSRRSTSSRCYFCNRSKTF